MDAPPAAKFAPCLKFVPSESRYASSKGNPSFSAAVKFEVLGYNQSYKKNNAYCKKMLPMKSMTRRPSQNLPAALPKKVVSPLGESSCSRAAERAPVSEFESPKLYIAGNLHILLFLPTSALVTHPQMYPKFKSRRNRVHIALLRTMVWFLNS